MKIKKKDITYKKVAEISNDDNEKNISEFIKLKDDWSNIGLLERKMKKNVG